MYNKYNNNQDSDITFLWLKVSCGHLNIYVAVSQLSGSTSE